MKATDLLREQHQEIDELFERISLAESGDMRALCSDLAATIVGHSTIEKEIFYPASKEALGASFQLQTAFEEHALVDYALQKLLSTDPGDESLHARVSVLKELVQHHVEEEEHELLKQADSAMNEEQLEELGARLEARFDEIREGDFEAILARAVASSMPAPARRAPAEKPSRKAAAKRPAAKRTTQQRGAETQRGAAKPRRAAAPAGRKKASAPAQTKASRTTSSRKSTRPTKASRTTRKGGRTNAASTR